DRVQRALIEHAFFRWESAVTIGLTAILTAGAGLLGFVDIIPPWIWPICLTLGLVGEGALVYSSLNDPETGEKVVAQLLKDEFHPERLHNKELQARLNQAFDYRSRIEAAIRKRPDTMLKETLNDTAAQIDEWLKHLYQLAQRLDQYQDDADQLNQDYQQVSQRMKQLKKKLLGEGNQGVRQQIQTTLDSMERQLETIDRVRGTMTQAELQIDHTLSSLGTIYSQAMLFDAKGVNKKQASRLSEEITEEIHQLDDVLLAMDEVYATDNRARFSEL
ncbi:MAG: hypothetical protein AAF629_30160, partial [Chloroflexota bacterium]